MSRDFLFPSRVDYLGHLSTRQYARLVDEWVTTVGLNRREYGTHSLRRTKASLIYKATGNLILAVNTLGPFILTALIERPERLIYLVVGCTAEERDRLTTSIGPAAAGMRGAPMPRASYTRSRPPRCSRGAGLTS
jgi:hypothetical protein